MKYEATQIFLNIAAICLQEQRGKTKCLILGSITFVGENKILKRLLKTYSITFKTS
jgi:hypothetical protein